MLVPVPSRSQQNVIRRCGKKPLQHNFRRKPLDKVYQKIEILAILKGMERFFDIRISQWSIFYNLQLMYFQKLPGRSDSASAIIRVSSFVSVGKPTYYVCPDMYAPAYCYI
jgi:hypothetical protein